MMLVLCYKRFFPECLFLMVVDMHYLCCFIFCCFFSSFYVALLDYICHFSLIRLLSLLSIS